MKFIGITGGVGAGKSEIIHYIEKHYKCEVYLADEVAHEVKKKGTVCYENLVTLLGKDVLDETGEIDKKKMADKIFRDDSLLGKVNQLIHPAVKDYLLSHLEAAKENGDLDLFLVEAALLIETGYKELVDEMWYVYATKEVRRERLRQSRGYSEDKIDNIMVNQLPEDVFRENCDFIIENNGDLTETFRRIDKKLEAFTWKE